MLDDEPGILKAVARTLLAPTWDVVPSVETTLDPYEAVAILGERPPKVLVTDFRMPEMDGVEVLRRAKELAPDTVRILLTGQADKENIIDAINAGRIFRYIAKPWDNERFARVVDEAIALHDTTLERRREFHEANDERQSLLAAVDSVGDIQRSLLPSDNLEVVGAEAACSFTFCEHATGDYVDAVRIPGGRTALIVGDVCGHGLGAALFVFTARALLRSGLADGHALVDVVSRTNRFLCKDMAGGRFLTLFLGIHDPAKESLTYLSAGHNPVLLLENGEEIRELERTAIPLGIVDDAEFGEIRTVPLRAGETLFAYTDGVVEARDENCGLFGEERLVDTVIQERQRKPGDLLRAVREALVEFVGREGAPQDDMSLLAYRPMASTARVTQVAAV